MRRYFYADGLPQWDGNAESAGSSSSGTERSTLWRPKGKRRGCSSQREQSVDASGRAERREPDIAIAPAEMSDSLESDSTGKRSVRVSLSIQCSLMAVVEITSRSSYTANMDEK